MNVLKRIGLIGLLLLAACALPQQDPLSGVREQVTTLPGAVVSADGLQISYPGAALFAEGSVLPLPGGMEVIEPLIDFLRNNAAVMVTGSVRSGGHEPEYDQLLAGKRLDLLMAIFRNRGLADERLQIFAEAGVGAPLDLRLQPFNAATSAGEKR